MPRLYESSRATWYRVSLALFALALVYALTLAARNGLAYIYAEPAKNYLQEKRDAGVALTETEWQAIHANLRQALSLAPNNTLTLIQLGRLHRIRLESDSLDVTEIERHGNLAIDYYEQAAMLRPAEPWLWISLAHVRWELYQDSGDAYHEALIHAMHFGPLEGGVQRWVLQLSLDTWASLSPDATQAVLDMINRALERTPEALDAIVDSEWQTVCQAASPSASSESHGGKVVELPRLQRHCEELALE